MESKAEVMARSRNLKPGFFTNDELAQCHYGARLLFAGLWTIADREGRLEDRPARIKAMLFPFDRCNVDSWLDDLAGHGFILRYESGAVRFIQILNFLKHQTPHQKEPESLIPKPDSSETKLVPVRHSIERGNQVKGNSIQESERGRAKFAPPSVAEVAAYCAERSNGIDAEEFVAHYASKGWKVGKNAMKDWKSAVITWEKNRGKFGSSPGQNGARPRAVRSIDDDAK